MHPATWRGRFARILTSRLTTIAGLFLLTGLVRPNNISASAESQAMLAFGVHTFIQVMFARRDARMTRTFSPDLPASLPAYLGHFLFSTLLLLGFSGIFYINMIRRPGDEFVATLPLLFAIQTAVVVAHGFIADWRAEHAAPAGPSKLDLESTAHNVRAAT